MRYILLVLILAFALPPAAALSDTSADTSAPPAYENVEGVLKKVGSFGRALTIEDAKGGKTKVDLPEYVRVQKRITLAELAVGEKVHVKYSSSGGEDVIGTIQINRRWRGSARPIWDGRPLREAPRRYQGWVSSLDLSSRRLAIQRIDGEIRWFSVRRGALLMAIGFPDMLEEGDAAMVSFKGSARRGKPILVQAESPKAKGRRR